MSPLETFLKKLMSGGAKERALADHGLYAMGRDKAGAAKSLANWKKHVVDPSSPVGLIMAEEDPKLLELRKLLKEHKYEW